jgi:hypothetical protein
MHKVDPHLIMEQHHTPPGHTPPPPATTDLQSAQSAATSDMHLRFLHDLGTHFFLALYDSPLFGGSTAYFAIHILKDILVASKFWPLRIQLLLVSICRFLCRHKFSAHFSKYQGAQLLEHMVGVC